MNTNHHLHPLDLTYIALFVALLTICAWITIPFTVPFTMQTFGIFLTILLLGTKRATLTILSYLLLGMTGCPVFSGFQGGVGTLFGMTGGYLIGFLFSAVFSGSLLKRFGSKKYSAFFCSFAGLLFCYAFGTFWVLFLYTKNAGTGELLSVLSMCVFPFIIPDIAKISLAILLSNRVKPHLHHPNTP